MRRVREGENLLRDFLSPAGDLHVNTTVINLVNITCRRKVSTKPHVPHVTSNVGGAMNYSKVMRDGRYHADFVTVLVISGILPTQQLYLSPAGNIVSDGRVVGWLTPLY